MLQQGPDVNGATDAVTGLLPELTADLARLVAIPSVSVPGRRTSACARSSRPVGPSVLATVASTAMWRPARTASAAMASSIFKMGTATLSRAASTVSPTDEHAFKMTWAPASAAERK